MISLDSYSRPVFDYLDPILIYISLWIDCLFETREIAVCFLWLLLPGHYRVTDEALLAETTYYYPSSFLWMFSLLLKGTHFLFLFALGPGPGPPKWYLRPLVIEALAIGQSINIHSALSLGHYCLNSEWIQSTFTISNFKGQCLYALHDLLECGRRRLLNGTQK